LPSTPSSAPPEATNDDSVRSRRARWILVGIAATVVLGVGAVTWTAVTGSDDGSAPVVLPEGVSTGGPRKGEPAPDFTLRTFDGDSVSLSDYRGKPVVLNFWAAYCKACREEFPLFREELAAANGDFVILGVNTKDIESDGQRFARREKATWPIVVDTRNEDVANAYGVGSLPQTYFIRPDGTVSQRYFSEVKADDFADEIAKIRQRAKD
jgi:peroxiredoxin